MHVYVCKLCRDMCFHVDMGGERPFICAEEGTEARGRT